MYFHGARFSNYEAWLSDPTHIGPSAQVVLANSGPRNPEWRCGRRLPRNTNNLRLFSDLASIRNNLSKKNHFYFLRETTQFFSKAPERRRSNDGE
jgi:hypothetical protein